MRLIGYCESCHKIKPVQVSSSAMVRLARNQPVFGTCSDCEERQRLEAKGRHPAYRLRRPEN